MSAGVMAGRQPRPAPGRMRRALAGLLVLLGAPWSAASATAPPLLPPCSVEALAACQLSTKEPEGIRSWKHRRNGWLARSGAPNHSIQDVLVAEGSPITLEGKFTYGDLSKDLERDTVLGFLSTADGWISLGEETTDEEGRVRFKVTSPLSIGVYGVQMEVAGDASVARARVWVLPRGTHLAIFDIDGTLTTRDEEILRDVKDDLFFPILHREYTPAAYPGAARLTLAQAARGSVNVYLTGRPYWLAKTTRLWLEGPPGFAPGILHVTDSDREAVPRQRGVGSFKRKFLEKLVDAGFVLDVAYGNAKTDIDAYLGAGLTPDSIWIIGPSGGRKGTRAVKDSWEERANEVETLPPVSQPWRTDGLPVRIRLHRPAC